MSQPNLLWIILDDTSREMFGFGGASWPTPHIDRLACESVEATCFHTVSPICTPSRYSYLTGRYPTNCPSPDFEKTFAVGQQCKLAFNTVIDAGDHHHLPGILHQAGYRTGIVGKFHTGPSHAKMGFHRYQRDEDPADPVTASKLRADYARQQSYFYSLGFDYADGLAWSNTDNRPLVALQEHNLEWQADHALRFIDQSLLQEQPFCLYFATTTQHGPHHAHSLEADPRITDWGFFDEVPAVQPSRSSVLARIAGVDEKERHLAAGAVWTDDAIGVLLAKLEHCGVLDNTIVVFCADHGPGTRSGKFTCYQGGTRIPLLIRYPKAFTPDSTCGALLQNIDILPTLAALCGLPETALPERLDGRNRLAQLQGMADDREYLFFELGNYRAVRNRRYKYIALRYLPSELRSMERGEVDAAFRPVTGGTGGDYPMWLYPHYFDSDQLYDLEADPGEQRNLIGEPALAEVLTELRADLGKHLGASRYPFPAEADAFQATPAYTELTHRSRADTSPKEADWYLAHAW